MRNFNLFTSPDYAKGFNKSVSVFLNFEFDCSTYNP